MVSDAWMHVSAEEMCDMQKLMSGSVVIGRMWKVQSRSS